MFKIENKNIYMNRGDSITIKIRNRSGSFNIGDVVTFSVMKKGDCTTVLFQKAFTVEELIDDGKSFEIVLESEDTRSFCPAIKTNFMTYWYEIELRTGTRVSTLIGYDASGAREFVLYPEAIHEDWSM